ncbi:unnamed protein product (macronuclear) [Paramecium tetraurelia]|uniref:Uncharacterized protein n=1 Tax=Paramecium tetraurelia TaxID=5888 RepID=A0E4I6_PARTE|nr:uncharacterized protein GSPATT00023378001 [Paramecium tetraurelia]CAK90203.1 unnamed protein product [Paramecium tetraurelia]|eukprot:XP_001457600.1 hypothetical protein (macronuclear) [Paramecium tetraurelia strain d4-2]
MSSFDYPQKLSEPSSLTSIQSFKNSYEEDVEEIGIVAEKRLLSQLFEDSLEYTNINIQVIQEIVISKRTRKERHLSDKQLKSQNLHFKCQESEQRLLSDSQNGAIRYPCCRECCTNEQKLNDIVAQDLIQVTQAKEAAKFKQETVTLNLISKQQQIGKNNDLGDKICKKILKIEESQHLYIQPYQRDQRQEKWY